MKRLLENLLWMKLFSEINNVGTCEERAIQLIRRSGLKLRIGNGCWHAFHVQHAALALEAGFFAQEGLDAES